MAMSINTNVASITARNRLAQAQMKMSQSLERLSSGQRINRGADDAAGLAVSEKMRAQIKGLTQASRNSQDAISMIQTGEGALNEVHSMLQRMRELAVQASNDTLSTSDRGAINTELQQLKAEVNNVSATTKFNGKTLLTGSMVTTQNTGTSTVLEGNVLATTANATVSKVDVSGAKANETYTLTASATAGNLILTRASDSVSQEITVNNMGANSASTLDFSQLGVKISLQSEGAKAGADIITDLATKTVTTASSAGSANFQTGAYATDFVNVSFNKVDISASGMSALNTALVNFNTTQNVGNAQALITAVDGGIDTVNTERARYGAAQNRLTSTINSLGVAVENLSASESRIRDTDVAEETSKMVTAQILTQAGTSILSQANQAPQGALTLLRG